MIDDELDRLPTPPPRRSFISKGEVTFIAVLLLVIVACSVVIGILPDTDKKPPIAQVEVGPSEYLDLRLTLLTAPAIKPHIRVVLRDGKVTYNEYHALKVIQRRLIKREFIQEAVE